MTGALELSRQPDRILKIGPMGLVARDDLTSVTGTWAVFVALPMVFILTQVMSSSQKKSFFLRMRLLPVGGSGFWKIPWHIHTNGSDWIWFPLASFLQCHTDVSPGESGVLVDLGLIDEKFCEA